jgi:hypothetical protein
MHTIICTVLRWAKGCDLELQVLTTTCSDLSDHGLCVSSWVVTPAVWSTWLPMFEAEDEGGKFL